MSDHWLKPKRLSKFLRISLENGNYRLTDDEIARGIFDANRLTKAEVEQIIDEIRRCWYAAEKHLRKRGICAIRVTEFYFDSYDLTEPKKPTQIMMCIAGSGKGRAGFGVRLLSLKGSKNDPMALMYLKLRSLSMHGMEAAILDRITIEWMKGKLSKPLARTLADGISEPALPDHDAEFAKLMEGGK
jgi:hypothetical protein